jgi:transposase
MPKRKPQRMYPQELKDQVINMVLNGKKIIAVSRDLEIPASTIDGWIRKYEKRNPTKGTNENLNMSQLLKKLRDAEEERDILKKALAIFSKRPEKNMIL